MKKFVNTLSRKVVIALSLITTMSCIIPQGYASTAPNFHEYFVDFISPMYTEAHREEFILTDWNGETATDSMIADTSEYVESNDWDSVYAYFVQHIETARRDVKEKSDLRMDVSITRTSAIYNVLLQPSSSLDSGLKDTPVSFAIQGTIHYDPNTYKISSTSTAQLVHHDMPSGTFLDRKVSNVQISSNRYSANFSITLYHKQTMDIEGVGVSVNAFQPVTRTFTVNAQ